MPRDLSQNEKSIYDLFSNGPSLKFCDDISSISLNAKKQKLFISDPLVYEVEGTDTLLILGIPRQSILKKNLNLNEVNKEEVFNLIKSQVKVSDKEIKKSLERNGYDLIRTLIELSKK
ncbi:hypothetical protein NBO_198g0002 [Nosema bombycis CQ1]|uniref:Nascent polypeptide-associated complex subunit beta n=1 Tax=Nosema bombycis (strain CQ1 / CVCC 102059) TaxID=578461 RepID=R0MJX0_NOSB1|nr:hypothetical protein NBO_198g0002 [Nosema bombycis CQ1]|eukprot:EOB13088.1 hypothetical protein NBO_198g0002 [Nosema bombycis CQ1]